MLCPFKRLLNDALTDKRAVGAFNVGSMEMLIGILKAAEERKSPIILQIAEKRFAHSPVEYVAPIMLAAAHKAKIEIAVELDHGCTLQNVRKCVDYGFNTIMYDTSEHPIDENIRLSRDIAHELHEQGIALESEIGIVGGSEGGADMTANCASLEDIVKIGRESECDALAVAIGNAHGHYKGVPKLNLELLRQAHEALPGLPLVLHGGSGISPEDFRRSITLGIAKINIATANFDATARGAWKYAQTIKDPADANYFKLNEFIVEEVFQNTVAHIDIFNNK